MKTIFVVLANSGYGDMHHEWLVAAHTSAEAAEAHRVLAQQAADELLNRHEALGQSGWFAQPTRYDLAFESWGGDRVFYMVKPLVLFESALPADGMWGAQHACADANAGVTLNRPAEDSFGDKLLRALRG